MDEVRESVTPQSLAGKEVFHYSIPAIAEHGDGIVEYGDAIGSAKPRLLGGELLVSKLNPRKGHVLIARAPLDPTICSGEFIVLKPRACDVRFMFYVFSSEVVRQELDARVQSVTKSHQRVDPGDITKLWISAPGLDLQRHIAGFLDRETTRMDELIQQRRNLVRLVESRRGAVRSNAVLGRIASSWHPSQLETPRCLSSRVDGVPSACDMWRGRSRLVSSLPPQRSTWRKGSRSSGASTFAQGSSRRMTSHASALKAMPVIRSPSFGPEMCS